MARIPGLPPGSTRLVTYAGFIYGLGLFFLLFTIVDIVAYVSGYDNPYLPAGIGICASLSVILLGIGAFKGPAMWRTYRALREEYKKDKALRQESLRASLRRQKYPHRSTDPPLVDSKLTTIEMAEVRAPLYPKLPEAATV